MTPLFADKMREHSVSSFSSAVPDEGRPTIARIDMNALSHNLREVIRRAPGRKILAVVKAEAYGHGAVAVSSHLLSRGVDMLGVALIEEGRELREAGIHAPILVMGASFPEQAEAFVQLRLTPVVYTMTMASALSHAANKRRERLPIHIKIDTGMGRIGITPEDAPSFIQNVMRLDGVSLEGLMTHFADADLRDKKFAAMQMDRFETLIRMLDSMKISIPLCHASNSAAVLDYKRALFNMVRPGIMLYGYNPLEADKAAADLKPALSLITRIAFIKRTPAGVPISYGRTFITKRESLIATIPIGYADGYSRSLSNKGEAIVRGKRVRVAGRVCMDMTMLDVTDVPGVAEEDEVVLIGAQESERITADDVAAKTGTISYEVLCGISSRVPRVYIQGN